jgi:tetratricopeptide (TPR) repeat protein
MNLKVYLLPLFLSLLFACGEETNLPANNAGTAGPATQNGHARMVAILDSVARNSNWQQCYNLNAQKAEFFRQQMEAQPAQKLNLQFKYGEQLLYAGNTEASIVQLADLVQKVEGKLTDQTKIVHEVLALAYLRLGEQQNCINQRTAESCIIPIKGDGVYRFTSGPENAIKIYEQILAQYPDDLQTRWLLNIAYMNLGKYPAGVPKAWLAPESIFRTKGDIRFKDIAIPLGLDIKGISGGVCMEDFDGDGNLDLFMTSYGLKDQARFFKNNGDGSFSDRTHEANLDGIVSGLNTLHADYDNDGDRDILILRGGWLEGGTHPNSLLRNNGNGTFTDVTIEAGLLSFHPTQAAAWADYDADGDLDLYIANESLAGKTVNPNEFYQNNGNGTFTNVAQKLGVNFVGFFKACHWGDINNDRLPDLYLSAIAGDNKLLVNRGGKFEDIAAKAGVTKPLSSFPCWFFDFDNDGWDDIFVSGYDLASKDRSPTDLMLDYMGKLPGGDYCRLYKNNGNETFTDVASKMGLNHPTFGMGSNFGDLDNDGWSDFYLGTGTPDLRGLVPNRMFWNQGGKRFEEISMNGFAHIQKGHGVAFGDLDNDGDQDIYEVMGGAYEGDIASNILFENPGAKGHHWLCVELEGVKSNKDAIGAKIGVFIREKGGVSRTIWSKVNTGGSFGSASLRQEIGLGNAEKIEKVEVHWAQPGPEKTAYVNVPLDRFIKIKEGASEVELLNRGRITWKQAK